MARASHARGCQRLRWKPGHPLHRRPRRSQADQALGAKVVLPWGAPPSRPGPGPLPYGWDDGGGDAPAGTGVAYARQGGSGPVQRINRSHTSRTTNAHTKPPTIDSGTPSQKPQPAQLASHHDISTPKTARPATNTSEPTYNHRTSTGPHRRSNRTSRRSASLDDDRSPSGGRGGSKARKVMRRGSSGRPRITRKARRAVPHACQMGQ